LLLPAIHDEFDFFSALDRELRYEWLRSVMVWSAFPGKTCRMVAPKEPPSAKENSGEAGGLVDSNVDPFGCPIGPTAMHRYPEIINLDDAHDVGLDGRKRMVEVQDRLTEGKAIIQPSVAERENREFRHV
jgi:hypothetical protein